MNPSLSFGRQKAGSLTSLDGISMNIKDFLSNKPNLSQILEFVESEAQRIAAEKRQAEGIEG